MNRISRIFSVLLTVAVLVACASINTAWSDNRNAATGKSDHRTWVVYQESDPRENPYVKLLVGDAFRLTVTGPEDQHKFKLKALDKLNKRWGTSNATVQLETPTSDLLCGEFKVHGHEENFWIHIDTSQNDILTIALTQTEEECQHRHAHPGHARAQN